jgi:hypothetical protein
MSSLVERDIAERQTASLIGAIALQQVIEPQVFSRSSR